MLLPDLETPALVCDLDLLERNLDDLAGHCRQLQIPLRTHAKAHKIPEIAHWQIERGACGICCQKVGEAGVMVAAGLNDIFLPYNIVGRGKAERLLGLSRRAAIAVAADSVAAVSSLSEASQRIGGSVSVLIELEVGCERTGVPSPQAAVELGRRLIDLPGIHLRGLMLYPSRESAQPMLDETLELFRQDGLPTEVISGGGTGAEETSKSLGCTETRSGSYLWKGRSCPLIIDDIEPAQWPLRIITTVISTPVPGRLIVDAGLKTFGSYPSLPNVRCAEEPAVVMTRMSVEHGHCEIGETARTFRVGDQLSFLPLHPELALNLSEELTGHRDERIEVTWPIAARGKVR